MKNLLVAAVSAGVGVACAGNAFAHNNNNGNSSSAPAPAAHHSSSSTTTSTPHYSGVPHPSGAYQPRVNFSNGNRTLTYPSVHNSTLRQRMYSNRSNFADSNRVHRNADAVLTQRSSKSSALDNSYAMQRSGNLRATNFRQTSSSNATTKNKLDPQTSTQLRNWNGNVSSAKQARLNNLNNIHNHPNRWWWRRHCVTFIFFDFGWWGWYDGWWYPAWGYDPYSYYGYSEPIYGYDGESPEQIVAGVQAALQQRGYYQYAVDGRMGPLTRAAIARYQQDRGLPITSGLDPATLGSLGIIR